MENKKVKAPAAKIYCITPPTEEQKKGLSDFLFKKYGTRPEIEIVEDKSLAGGFRLEYGGDVYDSSAKANKAYKFFCIVFNFVIAGITIFFFTLKKVKIVNQFFSDSNVLIISS